MNDGPAFRHDAQDWERERRDDGSGYLTIVNSSSCPCTAGIRARGFAGVAVTKQPSSSQEARRAPRRELCHEKDPLLSLVLWLLRHEAIITTPYRCNAYKSMVLTHSGPGFWLSSTCPILLQILYLCRNRFFDYGATVSLTGPVPSKSKSRVPSPNHAMSCP